MARRSRGFNLADSGAANEAGSDAGQQPENHVVGGVVDSDTNETSDGGSGLNGASNGTGGNAEASDQGSARADLGGNPGTEGGTGKIRKKRGPNKPKTAPTLELNVGELAGQIQGLHAMLATLTNQPVFQLTPIECTTMAKAIQNYGKHYKIDFDSPRMALVNLIGVVGMAYIPRIIYIRSQAKQKPPTSQQINPEATAPVPSQEGVIDFTGDRLADLLKR